MSQRDYLEKLLDGAAVAWVPLGEVAILRRGRVMSKGYLVENAGQFPVYSSQTARNGMIGKIGTFDFEGEFVSWTTDGANAGTVFYRTGKFSITNVCGVVKSNGTLPLNLKFLFYWLSTEAKKHVYSGMGNPKLMSNQVAKIPIPIPCPDTPEKSLAIQGEIVRILDAFTALTAELTAELTARKKQYNYYRDQLLTFEEGEVEWKTLGEVVKLQRGKRLVKSQLEKSGNYAVYQNSITPLGYYHESNVKSDTAFVISNPMSNLSLQDQTTEFLLYTAPNGEIKVEVLLRNETIWLTQKRMAELFGVGVPAISKHLENIYSSGELDQKATISILETVQQEGKREVKRKLEYYNLDAVISVGYRVNSAQATQFRIWATQLIKEYIIKGFAMDDERLKNGRYFGKDYFRELLERVRSIRASERRIYLQITDIFAECSIDYDSKSKTTQQFYAHVQDKFHYAITGHTAAEIISLKADASKPLMSMSTYKNAPDGRVLKSDTTVAKNYLSEDEIKKLERAVSSFFDYIEGVIERRNTFTMESFAESVNKFLAFNEYRILEGYGSISRKQAEQKAFAEYDKLNKQQRIESDFDRELKKRLQKKDIEE